MPASKGASVTASINGGEAKSIENSAVANPNTAYRKNTNISYEDNLCPGKNTLVITVTNPGGTESVTYTINIILHPTIKEFAIKDSESSISPAFDNNVEEYTITIQDATTELPITFKTSFENSRNLVNVTVPDGTVAFSKNDYSRNAIYEGNVTITPEMNEFQITVAGAAEGAESKTYTFKLNRTGTYEVEFTSNVENAVIRVFDKDGNKLTPDENDKFIFTRGETYAYTAVARGYVSAAGTVTGVDQLTDGKFVISLEKVSGVK